MFDRIKKYFRDTRINWDFPQYEGQCRLEHDNHAGRKYSTKQLETERKSIVWKIESQADSKFGDQIKSKECEGNRYNLVASEKENKLSYFTRHYKQELNELYENKNRLFLKKTELYESKNKLNNKISDAFEEKNKAYEELNYYKDQVDSWYAKSDRTPWLFGNSGKKLPNHSLFGQSFGDLESYKYDRDSAFDDVKDAKRKIGNLKQEQDELNSEISEIKNKIGDLINNIKQAKNDRGKMYELKKEGHSKKALQNELDEIYKSIKKINANFLKLKSERREYITSEKYRNGAVDLESKIKDIKMRKELFVKSFDLTENHQKRVNEHRELWLKQRETA